MPQLGQHPQAIADLSGTQRGHLLRQELHELGFQGSFWTASPDRPPDQLLELQQGGRGVDVVSEGMPVLRHHVAKRLKPLTCHDQAGEGHWVEALGPPSWASCLPPIR